MKICHIYKKALANSIFGLIDVEGKLPVTSSESLKVNHSLKYDEDIMYWANFVENGISIEYLKKIDSIANKGISLGAYPGCQVIVLHENDMIYSKSYGYLTYDSIDRVNKKHNLRCCLPNKSIIHYPCNDETL